MLSRRATLGASTLDLHHRTAQAVLASETAVRRPWGRPDGRPGQWDEILTAAGADLSRAIGASVLIDHVNRARERVGVIEDARVVGTEIQARLKFSGRAEVAPILEDIRELGSQLSVGYSVQAWQPDDDQRAAVPTFRATAWTLLETSLVAVAADPSAKVRSQEETTIMPETTAAPAPAEVPAIDLPALDRAAVAIGERERIDRITRAGKLLRMESTATEMVGRGVSADAAVEAMFARAEERETADAIAGNRTRITGGHDATDPENWRRAMSDALSARICRQEPPEGPARQYADASIIDLARSCLQLRGITVPRSAGDVWVRVGGLHSTSDFALMLADAQGKSLRQMYEALPGGVRVAARQTSARDFKTVHRLQSGEFPQPVAVNEHGEFQRGSMSESDETYSLATFGRIFGISRQIIINDDMMVFTQLMSKMATATSEFIARQLAAKLLANPLLSDSNAVFSVAHGNLQGAGSPPEGLSVATLSTARTAMRAQRGLDGDIFVRADPRILLVPAALETTAEQIVAQITADQPANVNPFAGRLLPVVEPRLDSGITITNPDGSQTAHQGAPNHWYLAADPGQIDGLEYAFLDGAEGPQTETRLGFDVDGVETKLRIDFGCGWLDFRGWQKTE